MLQVTGDVAGLQAEIQRLRGIANDPKNLMKAAGQSMVYESIPMVFRDSGAPGPTWAPLVVRQGGQPLMATTTHLLKKITFTASSKSLVVGVPDVGTTGALARVHQYGATIHAKNGKYLIFPTGGGRFARKVEVTIPARRYLFWFPDALSRIVRRMADALKPGWLS